jgi:hypothetical protein
LKLSSDTEWATKRLQIREYLVKEREAVSDPVKPFAVDILIAESLDIYRRCPTYWNSVVGLLVDLGDASRRMYEMWMCVLRRYEGKVLDYEEFHRYVTACGLFYAFPWWRLGRLRRVKWKVIRRWRDPFRGRWGL